MQNLKKRITAFSLSLIMCLTLVTGLIPIHVNAEGNTPDITKINLDEYNQGIAPEHTHVWTTYSDDVYHWQQCWCGEIKDKANHSLHDNGGSHTNCDNGYYNDSYRVTCDCGYQSKPFVIIHGRPENYINSKRLNYDAMSGKTFDDIMQISKAQFDAWEADMTAGTCEGTERVSWYDFDGDGLGHVFCGGPIIGDNYGIKGTIELTIGSEGDCGNKDRFAEYFALIRYMQNDSTPTRTEFITYLNNKVNETASVNRNKHILYGYGEKYQKVSDTDFNKLATIMKGWTTHTSGFGWQSMNIMHNKHSNNGQSLYSNGNCFDSDNNHKVSANSGVEGTCDLCDAHYIGQESYINDYWYVCTEGNGLKSGETHKCSGHNVYYGPNNELLGTVYDTYTKATNGTVTRTVSYTPVTGATGYFTGTNKTVCNTTDMDHPNPYTYVGTVTFTKNGHSRTISCGYYYILTDNTKPTAYAVNNSNYWSVTGNGTANKTSTQAKVKFTYYDPNQYSYNQLYAIVYDKDKTTKIEQGYDAKGDPTYIIPLNKTGNGYWNATINIPAEIKGSKNIYIQVMDSIGYYYRGYAGQNNVNGKMYEQHVSDMQPVVITYLDAKGPTVTAKSDNNDWAESKIYRIYGEDEFDHAFVGLDINDMKEVTSSPYNGYREYEFTGNLSATGRNLLFYSQDTSGNLALTKVNVNKIDNTAPTIVDLNTTKNSGNLNVMINANDNFADGSAGCGIKEYGISKTTNPDDATWQTSNNFVIKESGEYYFFAKDKLNHISKAKSLFGEVSYDIKYDANGGTNSMPTEEKLFNENYIIAENKFNAPYGYHFIGWNTKPDGSGISYNAGDIYTTNSELILYAQYSYESYITYNLDGGVLLNENPTIYNMESSTFTLNNPTKEGYIFNGWTGTDLTKPTLEVSITKGSIGDRNYTATWTPENYNITYNLNDGIIENGINPTIYNIESDTFTLNNPIKEGYKFVGWTNPNDNEPKLNVIIEKGSMGNKTYVANWEKDPTQIFNIVYNLEGGSTENANPSTYNIESESITLNKPTKLGYDFIGWTGTDLNSPILDVVIPTNSVGNRVYTANWRAKNYTISYNLDAGVLSDNNPTDYNTESDTITLTNPTKKGFNFIGWTGTDISIPTLLVTIPTGSIGDRTYTANYEMVDYIIDYVLHGSNAINPTGYNMSSKDIVLNNPVKPGLEFIGWTSTDLDELTSEVTIPAYTTGDKTYEAHFIAPSTSKSGIYNGMYWVEDKDGNLFIYSEDEKGEESLTECRWSDDIISATVVNYTKPTSTKDMFANCQKLKTVDLKKLDTSDVTDMSNMFKDCLVLENLDLSYLDMSSVTTAEGMFDGCIKLFNIKTPKDMNNIEIKLESPVIEGHTFVGWSIEDSDEIIQNLSLNSDIIGKKLIAHYRTSIIKLDGLDDIQLADIEPLLPEHINIPNKSGYRFEGYFDKDGVQYYDANGNRIKDWDKIDSSLEDEILYPKFSEIIYAPIGNTTINPEPTPEPILEPNLTVTITPQNKTPIVTSIDKAGNVKFNIDTNDNNIYVKNSVLINSNEVNSIQTNNDFYKNELLASKNNDIIHYALITLATKDGDNIFNKDTDININDVEIVYIKHPEDTSNEISFIAKYNGPMGLTLYRLYNPINGDHLHTDNINDKVFLEQLGWIYEGVSSIASTDGDAVYRLYNSFTGEHFYTSNEVERFILLVNGWNDEGIALYSPSNQGDAVYRLYNHNSGFHHYTKDIYEKDCLVLSGWNYEGIAWYEMK